MPTHIDPEATVNLPCPRCGEKSPQTIAALQQEPRIRCSACGSLFAVDTKKILQRVKEAQEKIDLERRRR